MGSVCGKRQGVFCKYITYQHIIEDVSTCRHKFHGDMFEG